MGIEDILTKDENNDDDLGDNIGNFDDSLIQPPWRHQS